MRTMSRSKIIVLAGALASLAIPARAAEVDKYLPNDAEVAMVLNIKQLTEAPLIKKHALGQLKEIMKGNEELGKALEAMGFDPLRDLTSITAAINGFNANSKGLVIAHGQFDTGKFEAKAEELAKEKSQFLKVVKEGNYKLYEVNAPGSEKPLLVALVDKSTIVASNEKEPVLEALAKAAGTKKSETNSALRTLIEKQDAGQTFWGVIPGAVLSKSEFASMDEKTKKISERIESITLGITVSKDIKLGMTIAAKTADNAKELAEDLKEGLNQAKGFLALMAGNQKNLAPVVDLVNSIKVATEGNNLTLKSEVSEEMIEKGLKQ